MIINSDGHIGLSVFDVSRRSDNSVSDKAYRSLIMHGRFQWVTDHACLSLIRYVGLYLVSARSPIIIFLQT